METRLATEIETNVSERLFAMGLTSEPVTVVKNGVECSGIRIVNAEAPKISPVVYYNQEDTVEEIMERITRAIQGTPPQTCIEQLTDPEYIAEHVYMTVQRCSIDPENVVKKKYLNLELVLRVSVALGSQTGSVKISRDMLELADMSEDVAWELARHHMSKSLRVRSIADELGLPDELFGTTPMAVCTTDEKSDGAVGLAFPELFSAFCDSFESDGAYLLPSSTEELIVIPDNIGRTNADEMVRMVSEINGTMVDPLIQLDPVVYRYDSYLNEITIAASLQKGGAM